MQYTETQLAELLKSVEKEFAAELSKSEAASAALSKAEDEKPEKEDKKPEEKPEPKEEKKEDKKEEAAPAEKAPEQKEEHKEEPKTEEKPEHKEEDGCDYDEEDLEHMHKMYQSMSKGELKAHHDSVRKALDCHMGKADAMAKSEETEVKTEVIVPNPEFELLKSELEAQKAKGEGLQKTLDTLQAFLTKLVSAKGAPQGKAITSLEQITKSEGFTDEKQLTKKEIDGALLKKSMDPTLAKSDRDAINAFYLNGAGINTISHLLK